MHDHSGNMQARTIKPVRDCKMRSDSWVRAPFCWFKGGNGPVSFGCCCGGGGPLGKRPGFIAGEKVGEARAFVVQALRLRRPLSLGSMGAGDGVEDEKKVIGGRHTVCQNRASPSSAA